MRNSGPLYELTYTVAPHVATRREGTRMHPAHMSLLNSPVHKRFDISSDTWCFRDRSDKIRHVAEIKALTILIYSPSICRRISAFPSHAKLQLVSPDVKDA